MIISPRHIRSAREALGWSQTRLAERAGLKQVHISNLESGRTENPTLATAERIIAAFEAAGVFFTANGIEWKTNTVYEIGGPGFWTRVLEDVYDTLVDEPDAEMILLCSDDRQSPPQIVQLNRKLRAAGIVFRQFVCEGNTYLLGPPSEYRWLPRQRFLNTVSVLYGDKLAICADDNTKAVVIRDPYLARSWRNIVDLLWEQLEQPKESTADVRF